MSKLQDLIDSLCPNGVEFKPLGEIATLSRGKVYSKEYLRDNPGTYPVYSSQTANDGVLGKIDSFDYDGEYLTWTTDGAYAGTIFHRKGKFSITNVCGLITLNSNNIILRFLYYWLSIEAPKYVYTGMGNPKLMSNQVTPILIPVPPLPVQEEIVRILDRFSNYAAELQAELQARKEQYEYYRNLLLTFNSSACGCGTDDKQKDNVIAPPSTTYKIQWKKMEEVFEMRAGKSIAASYISAEKQDNYYPCYGANGLRGYVPFFNTEGTDVIIGRQGALCGNIAFAEGKYYATDHAVVVKDKKNNPRFLFHLLTNADLNQYKTKGAQPGLSVSTLNSVVIPIPPIEVQEKIVAILDRFETLVNDISKGLPAEIEAQKTRYEYYRNKLLTFKPLPA